MKMEDMQGAKPDGKGGFVDSKGNGFSLNEQGEVVRDRKVAMKNNPNYDKGFIKAGWDDATDKLKSSTDKFRGVGDETFNNPPNSGDNKTTNNNANEGSQSNKNNVTQDTPPDVNSKSENSISKSGESVKSNSMFSKVNDFFGGSNGAKGRFGMLSTLGGSLAASYALNGTSAEASSLPNAKPVLTGGQEALLAGSNVTGAAEMGVGLTTLGASAMSGTVTQDIAKFGSSVILEESIFQLTGCGKPIPVRNQHKTDGAYL